MEIIAAFLCISLQPSLPASSVEPSGSAAGKEASAHECEGGAWGVLLMREARVADMGCHHYQAQHCRPTGGPPAVHSIHLIPMVAQVLALWTGCPCLTQTMHCALFTINAEADQPPPSPLRTNVFTMQATAACKACLAPTSCCMHVRHVWHPPLAACLLVCFLSSCAASPAGPSPP